MTYQKSKIAAFLYFPVFLLLSLIAGCVQSSSSVDVSQNTSPAKWDYSRMESYMANVPGIRKMQRWEETGVQGVCIETQHYQIFTTLTDPLMLRRTPSFLESVYKAYESQVPNKIICVSKFKIYLFGSRQEWEQFTFEFTGPDAEAYLKIKKGAYTCNGICVAYNIGMETTFSVLGHEGWHQFNQGYFTYRLPSWLDEGVATLFETCRYTHGVFEFRPQDNLMRLMSLKQAIRKGRMIPLAELISLNPGEVVDGYGGDNEAIASFYAQNYALVRFLREYKYGRRLTKYHNLLLGGLRGNWPIEPALGQMASNRNISLTTVWNSRVSQQLYKTYINEDIEDFENQYRQFCNDIVYHVRLKEESQAGK